MKWKFIGTQYLSALQPFAGYKKVYVIGARMFHTCWMQAIVEP